MLTLFFAEGGIEQIVEHVTQNEKISVKEKKNFFETLKEIVNKIVDIVKNYVTNNHLKASEKAVGDMSLDDIKKLRTQFLNVIDGAIANLENGVEINTERKNSVNIENKSWRELCTTKYGRYYLQSKVEDKQYKIPFKSEIDYKIDNGLVSVQYNKNAVDPRDYRNFVKAYADQNYVTHYENESFTPIDPKFITIKADGMKVLITSAGINEIGKKIRGKGVKTFDTFSSILVIDELIKNGHPESEEKNLKGRVNPFVYYIVNAKINDSDYLITLHIKNVDNIGRYHYHAIDKINVEQVNGSSGKNADLTPSVTSSTTINIAHNSENGNTKFSLDVPIEETKDLIAVHNISEEKLMKSLQLGGLPMPSIAVMKAKEAKGNSVYGNISLVFPKSTIDPSLNTDNKIYGGDAWTPVYPTVEYKINEDKANEIYSRAREATKDAYAYKLDSVYFHPSNLEDTLNRLKGESGLIDYYKNDYGMKQLYLAETGEPVKDVKVKETRTELSDGQVEMYDYLIENFGDTP